jgi:tetratricopeptide (TPR) repeat protein/cellulose biosynthesis protein BcsQ
MALANTAASLAARGKRVLCVDFDLEAPSLPSYGCFRDHSKTDGVVDFISEYRRSGVSPDIMPYISTCDSSGNRIWLMGAGNTSSASYSEKLASIDWKNLYEEQMGYLLFEDIKQQWAKYDEVGFDYVLIDSRTGHTDVGGICTRQLPNLVVVMFSPTEQNISGLKPIVKEIRREITRRKDPISVRFCASNIPDLDDEAGILADILHKASDELSFEMSELARIHHYSSLAILSHSIFVTDRPNSKLAKEYESLSREISSYNFEDEEGAKIALRKSLARMTKSRRGPSTQNREEALENAEKLLEQHSNDPEIAHLVANVRSVAGDIPGEIDALTKVLDAGDNRSAIYIARARALRALNDLNSSESDLRAVLADAAASGSDIAAALRMLESIGVDIHPEINRLLNREEVSLDVLGGIPANSLNTRQANEKYAGLLFEAYRKQDPLTPDLAFSRSNLILALIGTRQYDKAIEIILDRYQDQDDESMHLADQFNLLVAKWGLKGSPPHLKNIGTLFSDASQEANQGANFIQCKGLWHASEGRKEDAIKCFTEALEAVETEKGAFSCLSYLFRSSVQFVSETKMAMAILEEDRELVPFFFSREDTD